MPDIGEMTGILALLLIFGAPMLIGLVSTLLKHQRKMAELMRQRSGETEDLVAEVRSLREEVGRLRASLPAGERPHPVGQEEPNHGIAEDTKRKGGA